MTTCVARVWATDKQREAGAKLWKLCGRPAKGTIFMEGTVYTNSHGTDAPACGIHLRAKYPPEWTGDQKVSDY